MYRNMYKVYFIVRAHATVIVHPKMTPHLISKYRKMPKLLKLIFLFLKAIILDTFG